MFRSMKTMIVAVMSLIVLVSLSALAGALYFLTLKNVQELLGARAQGIAATAAAMIDADAHQAVLENLADAAEMPELTAIRRQLNEVRRLNNLETEVYTLAEAYWLEGTMVFVAVGNDSDFEVKGQPIEKHIKETLAGGGPGHSEIFRTVNGEFITGFAPIKAKDGKVTGVVEVALRTSDEVAAAEKKFFTSLLHVTAIVLGFAVFVSLGVASTISSPIVDLAKTVQRMAKGELHARVDKIRGRNEISELSHDFNKMAQILQKSQMELKDYSENLETKVRERTSEVVAEKQKIQLVLDNIEQGIFLTGSDFRAQEQFSRFLCDIMGRSPEQVPGMDVFHEFFSKLDLSPDALDRTRQCLNASIGEDELSWVVNCGDLPREAKADFVGKSKILSLDWTPVVDEQGVVDKVIVSVRDLTLQRAMEHEMAMASARSAFLAHAATVLIALGQRKYSDFVEDVISRVEKVKAMIGAEIMDSEEIFRHLHTVKGAARTLGFDHLVDSAHNAEGFAKQIRETGTVREDEFLNSLHSLLRDLNKYTQVSVDVFGWTKADNFPVGNSTLALSLQIVFAAFVDYLDSFNVGLARFRVVDEVQDWEPTAFRKVLVIIQHAITNTVDHGFVRPIRSGRKVRALELDVVAELESDGGFVRVVVEDNGYGIDFQRVRTRLVESGYHEMSNQEILAHGIFLDGISTADTVTELSGRGSGSAIMRKEAEELGGGVRCEVSSSGGMRLIAHLPRENCVRRKEVTNEAFGEIRVA